MNCQIHNFSFFKDVQYREHNQKLFDINFGFQTFEKEEAALIGMISCRDRKDDFNLGIYEIYIVS